MTPPAAPDGFLLREAFIYLTATAVAVPLFARLGLGTILGYLVAGMAIGPHGFGLIAESADVMQFAEFGIVLLLFVVGLELNPGRLWAMRRDIFGLGSLQVILCGLGLTAVLLLLTDFTWQAALVVGLPLALSSTALVTPYLQDRGLLNSSFGERTFAILLLQDLAIVPLLIIVGGLARRPDPAAPEGLTLVLSTVAAIAGLALLGRFVLNPLLRLLGRVGSRDIFAIAALFVVVGAAFLMESLHLSPAMGAFVAGVMLADSPYRHELEADIEPFRGLLLGLFFLAVGMALDFHVVLEKPLRVLLLVAAVVAVKTGVIAVLARLFGSGWRQALGMGLLLSQGGEFGFVLLSAAVAGLLIAPEAVTLFSAVITLSMLASLLLMACYRRLPRRGRDFAAGLAGPEAAEDRSVIVIGYGRFGQIVTQLLHARGVAVTLIDAEPDTIERSREFGWTVWFGDGFRPEVLRAAGADRARMLVVTVGGPWDPARLEAVRSRFPNLAIIARAHDREHYMRLVEAGVDGAVRELLLGAVALGRLVLEKLGTDRETVEAIADEIMRRDAERMALQIAAGDVRAGGDQLLYRARNWPVAPAPPPPATARAEPD